MTKEQEIIKSFLMSTFYWVDIDTCGTSGFEAAVCPQGKTHNWSFGLNSKKALKKWDKKEECQEWLPQNAVHKSLDSYEIDKSGKHHGYYYYTKKIGEDISLLLEIGQGSISGVGYSNGWQIKIGLIYKNFMFKLYEYQNCSKSGNYEIGAYYDLDYIKSIDLSDMKVLTTNHDTYFNYDVIKARNSASLKDMATVLSYAMEGDTLVFTDEFNMNFKNHRDCLFIRETLEELSPKKIVMQDNFNIEEYFDIPSSLESIKLDFEIQEWSEGQMEDFLDRNKNLGKYLNCSDDCEKLEARELYNKQIEQSNTPINLWFEYKELKGYVHTNKYQLKLLQDFYKDAKFVTLNVGDASFDMPIKKFWDSIRIEKKIKYASRMNKAHGYFGENIGFTSWFPIECDVHPKYKFEKEI